MNANLSACSQGSPPEKVTPDIKCVHIQYNLLNQQYYIQTLMNLLHPY